MSRSLVRRSVRLSITLLGCLLWCTVAPAQGFGPSLGGGGPPTGAPPGQGAAPKPDPNAPETHAASGGADSLVPAGNEPSLPRDPLKMKQSTARAIGSDAALEEPEIGRFGETVRKPYGLYYEERTGDFRLRTLFPLWFERRQPSLRDPTKIDRASLFGGLYYNRRSATHADDILFPIFWNLRGPGTRTTVAGPLVNRVAPGERDNWLAPLYFTGARPTGNYFSLPPLLTYFNNIGSGGFNLIGPGYCSWEGGDYCDPRTAKELTMGLAPLYFYGKNKERTYQLVTPLLHYHRESEKEQTELDVWGPFWREHTPERDMFHLLPIYWSLWGEDERHTTVLPFFHHGRKGNQRLHINPLFAYARGENGEKTIATWLYARYRGRTELDMYTPLVWHYRDPDIDLDQKFIFPLLYTKTSPRESSFAFFPFYGHFERYGLQETTWVTPLFRHSHGVRGWSTAINPIFYMGRNGYDTHTVAPPIFWDFANRKGRSTVAFPVYWRFSDDDSVSQLVGNVYYHEKRVAHGLDWEIHVFPAFSYGETPNGHWWNILYGLAGYSRRGKEAEVRTLWIPIPVSGSEAR